MDDMSEISNMSRSNNFRRVHKTASGISGIMKAVLGATQTGAAMFDEEELETELNIFCSDVIVSTKFTMSRLKHARKTPSIVRLELEDLLERASLVLGFLNDEVQMLELQSQIQDKVKVEIEKQQRDYFLNQQLKTIQDVLTQMGMGPVTLLAGPIYDEQE